MKIAEPADLLAGILVRRYKRFLTEVRLADETLVTAHTPNTGSMMQCAIAGHEVLISRSHNPNRKTAFTLELIRVGGRWVDTHTHRANRVVEEGLLQNRIRGFEDWTIFPETPFEDSRFDFMLEKDGVRAFLEVKNATLLFDEATACFPDAVTIRGRKHLAGLVSAVKQGCRGVVLFLVQRSEATSFSPADAIDPAYGQALRRAVTCGVEALAFKTRIRPPYVTMNQQIPVILP